MSHEKIEIKQSYKERINDLLKDESEIYFDYFFRPLKTFIRVNTLKISVEELKKILREKNWKFEQPLKSFLEAIKIESRLSPGELGNCKEHQLGYYYVQELSSMLPPLLLNPKEDEIIFDCCAAPGSKTTEVSALMKNKGLIVANDIKIDRIKALTTNLQRCGCMNIIVTKANASGLAFRLKERNFYFDKILLDAPCSGEGTIRKDLKTLKIWNENMIKKLSGNQKDLIKNCFAVLKKNGVMVYSTCTLAPEENEEVIDFLIKNYPTEVKIEDVKLEIKTRKGVTEWRNKKYDEQVKNCLRIYPQDNDCEGFFIAKIRRI